jgi:L-amino acid N-acyltransferase YncA
MAVIREYVKGARRRFESAQVHVRIIEKGILELTQQELRQCKSLSLRDNGLMCEDLNDWRQYESRPNRAKRKARVIMMKYDDRDSLIGWALILPKYKSRGYDAMFYVRHRERGNGYGSLLMDKVKQIDPKPYVFPHDSRSGNFFKKHRATIRFDKRDTFWLG